jgi:hypothetical protein
MSVCLVVREEGGEHVPGDVLAGVYASRLGLVPVLIRVGAATH